MEVPVWLEASRKEVVPEVGGDYDEARCQNRTEAEILKCGRDAEKCGKISEDRRDVASTYVLRPRLGIKCPEFRMVRKRT